MVIRLELNKARFLTKKDVISLRTFDIKAPRELSELAIKHNKVFVAFMTWKNKPKKRFWCVATYDNTFYFDEEGLTRLR